MERVPSTTLTLFFIDNYLIANEVSPAAIMIMKKILILLLILLCFFNAKAQTVAYDLPMTWEMQFYNSIMRTTLHEDGRLTSETIFGCYVCSGTGVCQVCAGTGGQYWYGMGMQPCGRCFGNGRCQGCGGKGYTVQNSTTQYGVTVVYDENGKMYVCAGPGGSSSKGHSCREREKVEVIEYLPTFGVSGNENVYCSKCGKTMSRHIHVLK